MYKIYADDTLIYDSTLEDYKISKGSISLETNKSGSFSFAVYPDHFYYDQFVRLKTVITVYKSERIVFRGRILNDVTDYWNNKVLTCEGELGFLQDSIIRPFSFSGTPAALFKMLIEEHNSQVDDFKRFKVGIVTVEDPNGYIARDNTAYESAFSNLNSRLLEDSTGGHIFITHGDNGADPIPTIHYLADFTKVSSQTIEFGANLKNYTKTIKAEDIATAIIPLGAQIDDGNSDTDDPRLTISKINGGVDYVYDAEAVALYGWIFKVVTWDDVTVASNLLSKAQEYLESVVNQNITIELNAIDLHLLDRSIESFNICDYVRVISEPHNFNMTLLCNKQTIDLLKPENDSLVLGTTYSTFTEASAKVVSAASTIQAIQSNVSKVTGQMSSVTQTVVNLNQSTESNTSNIAEILSRLEFVEKGYTALEYIESNGTQYIDTGFVPNQDTTVIMRYYSGGQTGEKILFGARTAYKNTAFALWIADNYYQTDYGNNANTMNVTTTGDVTVTKDKAVTSLNTSTVTYTSAAVTFQCAYSMYLFTLNQAGTANAAMSSIRLYSCQIYDNGVLVRDYIPCKNASGVFGLYDKVNAVFYASAGSGAFTGG